MVFGIQPNRDVWVQINMGRVGGNGADLPDVFSLNSIRGLKLES